METYKAPQKYPTDKKRTIFLGGSIEQGKATNWQDKLTTTLQTFDVRILNPRRDDYDPTQIQSIENPYFKEQVEWELSGLERADIIVMFLEPGTSSPISLLELGLFSKKSNAVFVCCPDGFWRQGNVEIVSKRYGLRFYKTFNDLEEALFKFLEVN